MATAKKKKEVKVRDLKPSKDAKGGRSRSTDLAQRRSGDSATRAGASRSLAGRTLQ
jgi:hypothetical protein